MAHLGARIEHHRAAFTGTPRRQAGLQRAVHPLVLGPQVEALRQRLVESPTWAGRFALPGLCPKRVARCVRFDAGPQRFSACWPKEAYGNRNNGLRSDH